MLGFTDIQNIYMRNMTSLPGAQTVCHLMNACVIIWKIRAEKYECLWEPSAGLAVPRPLCPRYWNVHLAACSIVPWRTPARPHCHGITLQYRIYSHICSSNFSLLILSNLHSLFFLHYLQCLFSAPKLFIIIWWHGGQPAPAQWWMVTPRGQWGHPSPSSPPPSPTCAGLILFRDIRQQYIKHFSW